MATPNALFYVPSVVDHNKAQGSGVATPGALACNGKAVFGGPRAFIPTNVVPSIVSAATVTLTADQIGSILQAGAVTVTGSTACAFTFPAATVLQAAMGQFGTITGTAGSYVDFVINNQSSAITTITPGAGTTAIGTAAVAATSVASVRLYATNVTPASEACVLSRGL